MNKEQLQEIKDRCEAATSGPWLAVEGFIFTKSAPETEYNFTQGKVVGTTGDADAEFIAHARQDIPALLAYVDELARKATPTNVIIETEDEDGVPFKYIHYYCPCCETIITQETKEQKVGLYRPKYHQDCGQRLNWGADCFVIRNKREAIVDKIGG